MEEKKENKVQPYSTNYFYGINGSKEPVNIQDFLDNLKGKKIIKDLTVDEFLKVSNGYKTNFDLIVEEYTPELKKKYEEDIKQKKAPVIAVGTQYFLPNLQIEVELQKIISSDLFLENTADSSLYLSKNQDKILNDENYVQFNSVSSKVEIRKDEDISVDFAQVKSLNIKVWVYSKAKDEIYDLSPFVMSCSLQKDMNNGSFSIELVPTQTMDIDTYNGEFFRSYNIVGLDGVIVRDWFTKFIQNNDVIFVRFEKLKLEDNALNSLVNKTYSNVVQKSELNDSLIWDMIGLVDNVNMTVNAQNTDYTVSINGSDLMKLFIEDGSYFIPLKFVEGSEDRWFYGGDPESSWFKRNMVTGSYDYYFSYEFQSIKTVTWFIINQLSNIGIVPDNLFAGCAKQTEKLPGSYQSGNKVKGIWQMIQVWVQDKLNDRKIVDRSLTNPEGSLMDFFNKICQQPFVEFWGDTWGSGFDIIIREPPFTKSSIQKVVKKNTYISVKSKDVLTLSLGYDNKVYSWYRLMPQNGLTGNSQYSALSFVPIIFLEEYVEYFGNKRCITNDIYLCESALKGSGKNKNENTLSQALQNDLLFVVETNCYLPFTRKGTITINGDRRIKVGTFILLESTNELFYVTGVNNSISFQNGMTDRITVLTVERGMIIDYIKDVKNNYFNIVNVDGIRSDIRKRNSKVKDDEVAEASTDFVVNKEVFDFFLKRKMFEDGEVKN